MNPSTSPPPRATHSGETTRDGMRVRAAVLSDGRRVLELRSALGLVHGGHAPSAVALLAFVEAVPSAAPNFPYLEQDGTEQLGIEARQFTGLLDALLEMEDLPEVVPPELARRCKKLQGALAERGVRALREERAASAPAPTETKAGTRADLESFEPLAGEAFDVHREQLRALRRQGVLDQWLLVVVDSPGFTVPTLGHHDVGNVANTKSGRAAVLIRKEFARELLEDMDSALWPQVQKATTAGHVWTVLQSDRLGLLVAPLGFLDGPLSPGGSA